MLNTLSSRMHASMEKDDDCERAKIVELRQTAFEHLEGGKDGECMKANSCACKGRGQNSNLREQIAFVVVPFISE